MKSIWNKLKLHRAKRQATKAYWKELTLLADMYCPQIMRMPSKEGRELDLKICDGLIATLRERYNLPDTWEPKFN